MACVNSPLFLGLTRPLEQFVARLDENYQSPYLERTGPSQQIEAL